ncbi:helix-turn-helix domain-containing protein [Streptococcus pluranimalium]|uniref:helix-turn-helix domain-containing protein n=1 Tax=Streptococcus pluranimalium TaxID=82348 RepID=UPI003F662C0A
MVDESKIVELLKNKTLTQRQIANQVGLSVQRISQINAKYNIRQQNAKRPWEAYEEDYLVKYVGQLSINQLARDLNRTKWSVTTKIAALGLSVDQNDNRAPKKIVFQEDKPYVMPRRPKIKIDDSFVRRRTY